MARSLRRDDRGVSTLWSFIGVVVLVAAILGVYYGYVVPKFAPPPLRAQSGDQVQVDYVGTFAENGLVFDTSVAAIAKDNASYPKAFMFAGHGEYAPLPVTVGSGGVVPGFDIGIQGLAIGDSKRIVVPPALGHGLVRRDVPDGCHLGDERDGSVLGMDRDGERGRDDRDRHEQPDPGSARPAARGVGRRGRLDR